MFIFSILAKFELAAISIFAQRIRYSHLPLYEPFGLAPLEAAAMGLVLKNENGARLIFFDGSGVLVDPTLSKVYRRINGWIEALF